MAKWLLIDGLNLAYRCFFALPDLTRPDGFPNGALHGWVKSIWRLQDQEQPAGTLVFFDLGGSEDRLLLHPEYKAQRAEMPEALARQLEPIKRLTRALGLGGIEKAGIEGDDLLASRAVALVGEGHEVLIVSADKDFAQLVSERISLLLPPPSANPRLGWRRLDAAGVKEKFGVPPEGIPDYLALVGDTSDNIPGLDGVGPKTAVRWLSLYGSLEGVIAHAAEVEPARFREVIPGAAERLRLNLRLTRLNLAQAPSTAFPTELRYSELLGLLSEYGLKGALAEANDRYRQSQLF
jgi:DNA polymerase-1